MPARKRHRDPSPRLVRKAAKPKRTPYVPPLLDADPDPMSDEAWECAPRNGNPLPFAACGGRHSGPCCGCGRDWYCCYAR